MKENTSVPAVEEKAELTFVEIPCAAPAEINTHTVSNKPVATIRTATFQIDISNDISDVLLSRIFRKDNFIQNTGNHLCFVVFIGNKTVRKFIVVAMTVLTSKPADHQTFPRSALLFADAGTGIPVTEHSLTDRA